MELIDKLKIYCGINEMGKIPDSEFRKLVRELIGLPNKKGISVNSRVRIKEYVKTSSYKYWLDKYFPSESTVEISKLEKEEKEEELPVIYVTKDKPTEIPEKKDKTNKLHISKEIVS